MWMNKLLKNIKMILKTIIKYHKMSNNKYVLNPISCKLIVIGGDKYKELIKDGVIFNKFYDHARSLSTCGFKGCKKRVRYFTKDDKYGTRWCVDHKLISMIPLDACTFNECTTVASYKTPGESLTRCTLHKTEEMVPAKKCIVENCKNLAGFGVGQKKPYCKTHSDDTMTCKKSVTQICKQDGCNVSSSYGMLGGKPEYCASHRPPSMIFIPKIVCHYELCPRSATHGHVGEKPTMCSNHIVEGMINTYRKVCKEEFCKTSPSFAYPGKPDEYCHLHHKPGMIDNSLPICIDDDCGKICYYGFKNKKAIYCKEHKQLGMINLSNSCCNYENCEISAKFGFPGEKPLYCKTHSNEDHENVKIKKCDHDNCKRLANYNIPGVQGIKCSTHKTKEMISNPTKKCTECKTEPAIYGLYSIQERCELHKIEGDINQIEQDCISCHISSILDFDKKCFYCSNSGQLKMQLKKQNEVVSFLRHNNLNPDKIDKQLEDGSICKLQSRPDIIFDCSTHFIIVEVDEHQHKSYNKQCEINRMINITQVIGIKTIFIRYNPDKFKTNQKEPHQIGKFKILKEELEHYMTNPPDDLLTVKYLFFDNYKYVDQQLRVIEM